MARKVTLAGARVTAGYSQQGLADKIGVVRETISAYETGKQKIPPAVLMAICYVTGFHVDDISLPTESTLSEEVE